MVGAEKGFVATVCWVATGRLVLEAGQYVPTRAHCIELCQHHLDRATANYVKTVYQKCKHERDYLVPAAAADRMLLRELCEQALPFFNEYLEKHGGDLSG